MTVLTIGVPVFNEIRFLPKMVAILKEIEFNFGNHVDFLFVDNFSTDGSREYLKEVATNKLLKNSRVFLNEENQGFNHSCDTLMQEAHGDYIWLMGAQEVIYDGSIEYILELLETNLPMLVICNARMRDEATDEVVNESLWGDANTSTYMNLESFFDSLGGPCQAVSCNILKTSLVRTILTTQTISHYWGYYERICDMLLENNGNYEIQFVSKPLIEILIERDVVSASGISLFGKTPRKDYGPFYTSLELAEIANLKFWNNAKVRSRFTIYRDVFAIPRCFVLAKSRGLTVDSDLLLRVIRGYRRSKVFWILGIPILLGPRSFSIFLQKTKPLIHLLRRRLSIKEF